MSGFIFNEIMALSKPAVTHEHARQVISFTYHVMSFNR
jgi:hypothetical protein